MLSINLLLTTWTFFYLISAYYQYQKLPEIPEETQLKNYFFVTLLIWLYLTVPVYILGTSLIIIHDLISQK